MADELGRKLNIVEKSFRIGENNQSSSTQDSKKRLFRENFAV